MPIRSFDEADLEAVVDLSLRAWAPVFRSIEQSMSPHLFRTFYPDWRDSQRKSVEAACSKLKQRTWVAEHSGQTVGFVALKRHLGGLGEIYRVAVDPDYQHRGLGRALTEFALARLRDAGLSVAMVETGGDPGHAPARRTYEQCGFEPWPAVRYFKKL